MEQHVVKSQKSKNLVTGIVLMVIGILFLISRFYVFPAMGLVLGVLFLGIGIYFLIKHRRGLT